MRLLSSRQSKIIKSKIADHHMALIVELCGPAAIPAEDFDRLRKSGVITKLPEQPIDLVTAAHLLGGMLADTTPELAQKLSTESFWEMARNQDTLTDAEHEAIELAKDNVGHYVKDLGNKYEKAFHLATNKADRKLQKSRLLRRVITAGLEDKKSVNEIAEDLTKAMKDSQRDWLKIAQTEIHNCMEEGKAIALFKSHGGDPNVYKIPKPDACPYCKTLYQKSDGTPKIFKLSDLMANGTNVGRKAGHPSKTMYKAVLGSVHPMCRCELQYLPKGTAINAQGQLITAVKSEVDIETLDRDLASHTCRQ